MPMPRLQQFRVPRPRPTCCRSTTCCSVIAIRSPNPGPRPARRATGGRSSPRFHRCSAPVFRFALVPEPQPPASGPKSRELGQPPAACNGQPVRVLADRKSMRTAGYDEEHVQAIRIATADRFDAPSVPCSLHRRARLRLLAASPTASSRALQAHLWEVEIIQLTYITCLYDMQRRVSPARFAPSSTTCSEPMRGDPRTRRRPDVLMSEEDDIFVIAWYVARGAAARQRRCGVRATRGDRGGVGRNPPAVRPAAALEGAPRGDWEPDEIVLRKRGRRRPRPRLAAGGAGWRSMSTRTRRARRRQRAPVRRPGDRDRRDARRLARRPPDLEGVHAAAHARRRARAPRTARRAARWCRDRRGLHRRGDRGDVPRPRSRRHACSRCWSNRWCAASVRSSARSSPRSTAITASTCGLGVEIAAIEGDGAGRRRRTGRRHR